MAILLSLQSNHLNYMCINWIWFILIGIVAGFLAGKIVKGSGFGLIINLIVGVVSALAFQNVLSGGLKSPF